MTPRKAQPELKDQREREILQAAAAVFAEHGFRGTRVADIARRAGIGKGTIYEYFHSKEDLFTRLFHWYTEQAYSSMLSTADDAGGSPLMALRRSCESLLQSCHEMQELYPLTMEFWSASTASEFREGLTTEFRRLYEEFRGAIADILRAGQARGEVSSQVEPEPVAAVVVGALDGLFLQAWFDRDFDPVAAGRKFLDVLVIGLRGDLEQSDKTSTEEGNEESK